ncbi:MAG TPA: T9SS type A sorting domain-containing protein [Bacteroidota bacterium]|nr:T9SS type A sorting domain-containing protein [Bacteroidota bacterium]
MEIVAATTPGSDGKGVYRSTDDGTTWSALVTGGGNLEFYSVAISPSDYIYAGFWGGLPVSTDGGGTWTDKSIGLPYSPIVSLASDRQDNVFAATGQFGTYRFLFTHWELLTGGLPTIDEGDIVSLAIDSAGNVFGGSPSEGVYRLPYGGSVWRRYNAGLTDSSVNSICIDSSGFIYAATSGGGVYRNGGSPLAISLSHFSAMQDGPRSTRLNWTTLSEINNYGFFIERSARPDSGFGSITANAIPGHGTTVQAHDYTYDDTTADAAFPWYRLRQVDLNGTPHYTSAVKATPLTALTTGGLPGAIQLMQNYPNPFNPRTVIRYALPSDGKVTLSLYNVLGQNVATLFDGRAAAGIHEVSWDAARQPSGPYYCVLRSGGSYIVKRMMLLK